LKRCEFDVRERETVEINTTYEGCSIMNSPSAQAMTADPSVVDAAVRFCDDVLASPTVELLKPRESYFRNKKGIIKSLTSGVDKTVTIPIANPTGAKVLSIVIHVPEYDVFHGSIVTAEGVCVARIHAQLSQRIFKPHTYELKEQLPVPIEWDSAPFGEVHVQTKDVTCCDVNHKYPDVLAQGPVDRIIVDMAERHPTRAKIFKAATYCCCLPGVGLIPGLLCFIYGSCCYPGEFHIKDSSGEKVGGFERAPGSIELQSPGVLHFEGMTSEQRRLALAAVMVMEGGRAAQRPRGGGGA